VPPIIEKCLCLHQLLPPFLPIFWFSSNLFDKSTPVHVVRHTLFDVCAYLLSAFLLASRQFGQFRSFQRRVGSEGDARLLPRRSHIRRDISPPIPLADGRRWVPEDFHSFHFQITEMLKETVRY